MCPTRIVAVGLVCLSGAFGTSSCVQGSEVASQTEGASADSSLTEPRDGRARSLVEEEPARAMETSRFGQEEPANVDLDGEPQGGDVGTPQGLAMDICYAAASNVETRRAFCVSTWVEPSLKQSCWAHVLESRIKWIGWCSWYF
jgi:hypothetical protein